MKTDGIASAASALRYWEQRQEVAANNLANADTDGFRAERVFAKLLAGELPVAAAGTDLRGGAIRPTGNALDVAVAPDEFLVVSTPAGERWSRGGSWRIDTDGFLTDADGHVALGERGPVRVARDAQGNPITPDPLVIDRSGLVTAGGEVVDRLRVERPVDPSSPSLQHEAGARFVPPAQREAVRLEDRDVRQGHLEGSNVNPVSSLIDLISIQRNYAFAQKVLTTLDGIRATIANDLAKPA